MKINLQEEAKKIGNWLVIEIGHERYCFNTDVTIYNNCSLGDVLKEYFIPKETLEKDLEKIYQKNYNLDLCVRNKLDTKYSFPILEGLPLKDIHIGAIHIIDMDYLNENEYVSFIWGSTDKKFGLIDFDRGDD